MTKLPKQWVTPNTVPEYYSSKMTEEEKDACDKSLAALTALGDPESKAFAPCRKAEGRKGYKDGDGGAGVRLA